MAAEVVTFQTDCWYLDKITQLGSRGATKKLAFPNSNRIWNFLSASSSKQNNFLWQNYQCHLVFLM